MDRRQFIQTTPWLLACQALSKLSASALGAGEAAEWVSDFRNPPPAVYPWVYSFWMEGNISKEGITADLEAMRQAGIRGLLFMDGALENPAGPYRFMSESWLEIFDHMLQEAARLGLEINLNNDPGWAGSAGPWVTPELASQKVIAAQTVLAGPAHFNASLAPPAGIKYGYYEDVAVLAFPLAAAEAPSYRIPDINTTKSFAGDGDFFAVVPWPRFIPTQAEWPAVPAEQCLESAKMVDLTANLDRDGRVRWDVPPGPWLVVRFGHTVSNGATRSAQKEAQGLEVDKLSKAAVEVHFSGMVGKLTERAGPLTGKVLVSTHIDSWEAGSGNWTHGFREEFRRRRGYDLLPFLPVLEGMVVDSREVSERFLWDYRETVAQLTVENYAGHMRELANRLGLRLSIEAYDGTCDDLRYAGRADEPMTEFWRSCYSGLPLSDLTESMVSAAHVYGKPIVGAEAFTSFRGDFLDHPATLKPMADWAFCAGVNRFCLSEWIMQPWPRVVPGVSFGQFGTVFHRSLTWWAEARAWHEYIARCQHLLRQGRFVADICFLAPEGAPYRFTPPIPAALRGGIPDRPPYNFDGCPAELVLNAMSVQEGEVALPSGMKYRLLVLPTYDAQGEPVLRLMDRPDYFYKPAPLPEVRTMTPELLRRIKALVQAGATVLGYRPLKSPSLAGFPACDAEVKQLADELWGEGAGAEGAGEHRLGQGRVLWGSTPEQVLGQMGVPPDFAAAPELKGRLNYTHRRTADGSEIYFVVNKDDHAVEGACTFRTAGLRPSLFWPQTGSIQPAAVFEPKDRTTVLPICLEGRESVFVVFRPSAGPAARLTFVSRDGQAVWPLLPGKPTPREERDTFRMAVWAAPGPDLALPKRHNDTWVYDRNDVEAPGAGFQTFTAPGQGERGFAIGKNGIIVYQYSASGAVQPLLVYAAPLAAAQQVGVVCEEGEVKLYLNGQLVMTEPASSYPPSRPHGWADRRPFAGEIATLEQFEAMLGLRPPHDSSSVMPVDLLRGEVWESGSYLLKTADGRTQRLAVHLPQAQPITGPWQVEFEPRWGGPASIRFDSLQDWSRRPEDGIKYYSGAAIYRKQFDLVGPLAEKPESRIYLDLGQVAAIARVLLNGHDLGTLWNAPFRVDATRALKPLGNTLQVKVANLWVNRLIGDEQLAEDSQRDAAGQVTAWPSWLREGKPSPSGRFTFTSRRQWAKENPPLPSGLLGPVRLLRAEKIFA